MLDYKEIMKNYLRFPDRSDFAPYLDGNDLIFFYSDEEGLKKSRFLAFSMGIKAKYVKKEKPFILELLEKLESENPEELKDFEEDEISSSSVDILASSHEDAPVIKLVNQVIINAVRSNASDIHFEGRNNAFYIRFRVDGRLVTFKKLPKNLHEPVIARIKVISSLDVAETRKPQDGRINLKIGNRDVDIRVSIMPSVNGEKAVLRILEKTKNLLRLESIGMPQDMLAVYKRFLMRSNGMILVTGPTGSGKTTTLYASLLEIKREDKNIMTIEDPVEYYIDGITQVQMNPFAGITFANAIRSFLRQDPDIILVGEIRDTDTAKAAIRASMTGHLVFSTLHTNDAPTAVARLIEMEIEPFLISSSLLVVLGQRLVRKICPYCKEVVEEIDEETRDYFHSKGKELKRYWRGRGCEKCFYTGYIGRTGVFELLVVDDELRRLINRRASAYEIKELALSKGFKTMLDHGLELINQGITTPEEVISVITAE